MGISDAIFAFFQTFAVHYDPSSPLILRKSILAIFTKFAMQDYWVNSLFLLVIAV